MGQNSFILNDNFGIGTASPAFALNVKAPSSEYRTALFETLNSSGPSVQIKGSKTYELRSTGTGASEGGGLFFIYDKDNELSRLTVDSSGNVGIGTTPSRKLDVNGVAGVTYLSLTANTASAPAVDAAITRPADGTLGLIANSVERLRIDSSGNVTVSTGSYISTRANDTATGGGQIYLNGATGNRIDFNTNGVAAPAFTTRSAGTRIVLYPAVAGAAVDYAFGIESATLWSSVPTSVSQFKWYAGTTNIATLSGAGVLTATTFSGALSGNATSATSASSLVSDTSTQFKVITFTGVGSDSGNGAIPSSYAIYQQGGSWTSPYPDLCIGYHTGIKIGAYFGYGGTRFYNNSDWATEIFSVGNGDNNVRVANTIYAGAFSGPLTGNVTGNASTATTAGNGLKYINAYSLSGATYTISGLNLNPYYFLYMIFTGVSTSNATNTRVGMGASVPGTRDSQTIMVHTGSASTSNRAFVFLDLNTGVGTSISDWLSDNGISSVYQKIYGITNASTTISIFTAVASYVMDAGTLYLYGYAK